MSKIENKTFFSLPLFLTPGLRLQLRIPQGGFRCFQMSPCTFPLAMKLLVSRTRALAGDVWEDPLTAATCCNFALASVSLGLAVTALWAFGLFSTYLTLLLCLLRASIGETRNKQSYEKPTCCAKKMLVAPEPDVCPFHRFYGQGANLLSCPTSSSSSPHHLDNSKMLEQAGREKPAIHSWALQNTNLHLLPKEKELTFKSHVAFGLE